ncbi:hypothetical protein D9611_002761 [Ephemerocybe angulata]|uniref:Spindle pole body component n=1 Tax=Ephemerocybe angulata TaxID=980116 RepID=A0A8H5FE99_9AGAR|nr:hypothetical protein D9611_002761 [Tulosesus angulatus]
MNPSASRKSSSSSQPRERRTSTSSASSRPSSSLSSRPSSSLSAPRPLSRVSASRPLSSLTTRPPSAGSSYRPQSRFSGRPPSRAAQRTKLLPQYLALAQQVTGVNEEEDDGEAMRGMVEYLMKRLDTISASKAAVRVDMEYIDRAISGTALKARVRLQEKASMGLEHCYEKLKAHVENQENDLDSEIKISRIPDHLKFLIELSEPPSAATEAFADLYLENVRNPPPPAPTLTWADILAEEPFEGEHWEGILDPINVDDDWDSTPSLSPLNSDDLALDDDDSSLDSPFNRHLELISEGSSPRQPKEPAFAYPDDDPALFEDLSARQYWRKEWESDIDASRPFDLGDPSTLGPSIARVAAKAREGRYSQRIGPLEKYIDEEDMVREVLMALQGRENIALMSTIGRFSTSFSTPRLVHLTPLSQASILESFARAATTVQSLRCFTKAIFTSCFEELSSGTNHNPEPSAQGLHSALTRTSEAFADAIDQEVRDFDAWCAAREEQICLASQGATEEPLIVSLLETQNALSEQYDEAFDVVLEALRNVFIVTRTEDGTQQIQTKRSPAGQSTFLLDTLFSTLQEHTERNSLVVSRMLMRIFVRTAEPMWAMVGKWLRDGMSILSGAHGEKSADLEEEFFIESSGVGIGMMSMGLLDPDFWKEGYSLREQYVHAVTGGGFGESGMPDKRPLVPSFLKHVADPILETGKAIGLVRALGLGQFSQGFTDWTSFADVIASSLDETIEGERELEQLGGRDDRLASLFSVSVDSLSRVVYDRLSPVCEVTGRSLVKIIVEDCELWRHVNAVEDVYLMRRGDAISHFIDTIDSSQSWADFHFLNTAFGDVVRSTQKVGVEEWIQLSLVRLSHRNHREADRHIHRTVKAFDGLQLEYAVPFPLTYIFRPEIIQKYSEIFALLLQIRRAKNVLERILVRGDMAGSSGFREEMKVFYAMRSRLSWFVNTLLNFLTTYVLHVQISKFHEHLGNARSLDEIVHMHDEHLDQMQTRCLLSPNAPVLHRSIISILDMCLHFSGLFVSYSGNTAATHDVSRGSITLKHRSRRLKSQQLNVIGFAPASASFRAESSDEDSDEEFDEEGPAPETSFSSMIQGEGYRVDDMFGTIEQMSKELDGLVRFVRRGVESLSGGVSEAAATFGVLAFALEDWDL